MVPASGLYVLSHLLSQGPHLDDDRPERYVAMAHEFVAEDRATLKTAVATYRFAPHLAWAELVLQRHRDFDAPVFLPPLLREAAEKHDTEILSRIS